MKVLHYSRFGYNGDYTYTSVCNKVVQTHQDHEGSTIHPERANCKECLETDEHKIDLKDVNDLESKTQRRIYISSDLTDSSETRSASRQVVRSCYEKDLAYVDRVFSKILDYAWHDLEATWDAVKNADEIYSTTSLMPLCGGYSGAPVIFNGMCERAVKEKISGKKVFILNSLENIEWDSIDKKIMKKAFKNNDLYMYDEEHNLVKIDVKKI